MAARRRPPSAVSWIWPLVLLCLVFVGACSAESPSSSPPIATAPPDTFGSAPATETSVDGAAPPPGEGGRPSSPTRTEASVSVPPPSPATSEATPSPDGDRALEAFLDDCERDVREWRAAQVSYPSRLSVPPGETVAYVAAVDIRSAPEPPGTGIPGPAPTAEQGFVRCEVAARLSSVGQSLEIDEDDWVLRTFTPSGVIRWSWGVTATDPGRHDLQLELQPAVIGEGGVMLVGDASTEVSSFLTPVDVEEDRVQQLGDWWSDHWGTVTLIAAGIGAAVLAVLKYSEQLARRWRRAVAAWRGKPLPPEPEEAEEEAAPTTTTPPQDTAG